MTPGELSPQLDPLDWLKAATTASDVHEAGLILENKLSKLGADSVGFVFNMPKSFGTFPKDTEMFGHFINPEWHSFYFENQDLVKYDVMARHLFTTQAPHFADMRRPSTLPTTKLTEKEANFLKLAADFGLHQTLAMSFFDGRTGQLSILLANHSTEGSGDLHELGQNYMPQLQLAAQFFIEGLNIRNLANDAPWGRLSPRERECLQWAATGRSTQQIADIMALSDNTVNEYFSSAQGKLRASNRIQAVIRAYAFRLVSY